MIVTLGFRVVQMLFGGVVLGLSVVLIKGYGPGKGPALIDYGAFCGGAGILFAMIGLVACFIESLQGIIILALDGLATFFLLAGALAYAVTLKVGNCNDLVYIAYHLKTFGASMYKIYPGKNDEQRERAYEKDAESRCRMLQADTAFLWFLFACFLATAVLSFTAKSRSRGSTRY